MAPLYHLSSFHLGLNLVSFVIKAVNLEKRFFNRFQFLCSILCFFRFGFLRFLGIVILSVLGTSVTYILLGRWLENHLKMLFFKIPTAGWCSR